MTASKSLPLQESPSFGSHGDIVNRIKKSLYYGKTRKASEVMDCPSLPLTEATVELFERAIKNKVSFKDSTTGSISKGLEVLDLNYASSLSEKACISPCSIVVALIYMERLKKKNPEYIKTTSPTDLFLISMLIASKYLFDDGEDEQVFNDEWAISASLELKRLNELEIDFLMAIDWDIHVKPFQFFDKLSLIETLVTWKQTSSRYRSGLQSGYTYQELLSLEHCFSWKMITQHVLKTITLTFLTYSAVLVAVCATTIIACSLHSLMIQREQEKQELDARLKVNIDSNATLSSFPCDASLHDSPLLLKNSLTKSSLTFPRKSARIQTLTFARKSARIQRKNSFCRLPVSRTMWMSMKT